MKIALFPNTQKAHSIEIGRSIQEFLQNRGILVFAEDEVAAQMHASPLSDATPASIDFIISMGGDGTILRLVHKHPELHAPILAINLGSFGFMADIPLNAIYPSLENLLAGKYTIKHRMMMEGLTVDNTINYAVNEITINRAQNPCLIDLAIYVDDRYLNTFSADGVILATPSGSTAYSLAAGGPILTPELNAFVITPICPHTISNRPIVLLPERNIRIEYISPYSPVDVIYDGFPCARLNTNQSVDVQRSNRTFSLVAMPDHDFFLTLRTKLGWAGKLKASF
ncbi:MAG: NAD(+)/NADH kinase [Parachlamydiaceae bacterium]|nr:NAD(+)/NADH kinase [Parachlamydiaceae bacterium]